MRYAYHFADWNRHRSVQATTAYWSCALSCASSACERELMMAAMQVTRVYGIGKYGLFRKRVELSVDACGDAWLPVSCLVVS
jgi:hypothetical protein